MPSASRQVDTDIANLKNNQAQVAQQQALVDYKFIKAPFAGRLGIRQVDLGQYIAAGTPHASTLQQLDPIYVDFFLPQQVARRRSKSGSRSRPRSTPIRMRAFDGEISAINPDGRCRDPQRSGARHAEQSRSASCCPACLPTVDIDRRHTAALRDAAARLRLPIIPTATSSMWSRTKARAITAKAQLVARRPSSRPAQTRGDQVAVLDGRQGRATPS